MGLVAGFTDRFLIALGTWPFASLLLTLPILALLYRRDGRLRIGAAAGAYLCVLYGLALVFFTLWPLPEGTEGLGITYGVEPQLNPLGFVGDIARDGAKAVFQIGANIAFFMPLGFALRRGARLGLLATAAIGLATSLLIETAQLTGLFGIYPFSYRTFDVDDLAWNVGGAALGWLAAGLVGRVLPAPELASEEPTRTPGLLRRLVALALDLVLVGVASGAAALAALLGFAFVGLGAWASDVAVAAFEATSLLLFVMFEAVVPWACQGCTPGGAFVRMTVESHPRPVGRRLAFYAVRLVTLAACLMLWPLPLALLVVPAVLLLYAVARRMPCDLVP